MLDPLFPVSLECLTPASDRTIVSGGEYLLVFPTAGRLAFKCRAQRGVLEAGRAFLAGVDLSATLVPQRNTSLYLVCFGRAFFERLEALFFQSDFLKNLFPGADRPLIIDPAAARPAVQGLCEELAREYAEKPGQHKLMIQCRLVELFILLSRARRLEEEPDAPSRSWFSQRAQCVSSDLNALIEHIQEHYSDEFSLNELAARAGLAPAYFSRLFHEKTGKPLFEFINSIRVQKACRLLKRTNLPIIEIAYAVGYNNLSFFNRYFRRLLKMSPREYRNL